MSNGLHLELDKKQIPGSTFSQGVLTLEKAGDFTVHIKEYLELLVRKSKLDPSKGRTLVDPAREKENDEIATLFKKFETLNWAWNTVYNYETLDSTQNLFVAKGFPFDGKTFSFPEVLEGGGYCYVEAFFEGQSPVGKVPNGLLIRAVGTPKIIRIEWTDMEYNPIKDTEVAFGSHLLLHIYTRGLYGQEILVGLKDVNGLNKDLNIANSSFFDIEVKAYPIKDFEKGHLGVSGLLVKSDNPEQAATTIQKAEIEVGIDYAWMFGQTLDVKGQFGNELQIETSVIQKSTKKEIEGSDKDSLKTVLNVSLKDGKPHNPTPEVTNMPVVVGEIDTVFKTKKTIDFTFGIFLDGTLNNMYDTEVRQLAEGKNKADATGLGVTPQKAKEIFADKGDKKYEESSYENDLSNPAILFKNYLDDDIANLFAVYIEGIGTNSAPAMPKATENNPTPVRNTTLNEKDYKKNDVMQGPAFGMGSAGIKDRVKKGIKDVVNMIKAQKIQKDKECVGTITFDVFGFSRGAAAARHFVHVVTHGPYIAKMGLVYMVEDLQNNSLPVSYSGKLMPKFGVLGQLLTEAELMDENLTNVEVRFLGIYDTVPHHGLFQDNDIRDLGLDNINSSNYVVHMVAGDEYRKNFSLVDISQVPRVSPYSGTKGGIELIYPGVHCDVGGAYVEGGSNHPYKINISTNKEELEKEKIEFARQGWFQKDELSVYEYETNIKLAARMLDIVLPPNFPIYSPTVDKLSGTHYRLEGWKKNVSNQYSYIPLHFMANFCELRSVPIKESDILRGYDFKDNKKETGIVGNVAFLEGVKSKLWEYTFRDGEPITFENSQKDVSFLRYHYLHWNATYGDSHESVGTWLSGKNDPNMDDVTKKRKRHVR